MSIGNHNHWTVAEIARALGFGPTGIELGATAAFRQYGGDRADEWIDLARRLDAWYACYRAFAMGMTPADAEQLIGAARAFGADFDAALALLRAGTTGLSPEQLREAAERLRRFAVE